MGFHILTKPIILDAGPLGQLAHPRAMPEIISWIKSMVDVNAVIIIPEIADYEVRRNLILHKLTRSVAELDRLKNSLKYQPLTTTTMLKAAELWADARRRGQPTADSKELDGDVILAAQAIEAGAIVATDNVGHIGRYVTAKRWQDIGPT